MTRTNWVVNHSGGRQVFVPAACICRAAGAGFVSVPAAVVESAVLSQLPELRPADVASGAAPPAADAVEMWSGKLAAVNQHIERTKARATAAEDPAVYFDMLDAYAAERKRIIAELEKAKAEAASPAADALGETISLIELLKHAKPDERDELRQQTRGALARLVSGIDMTAACSGRAKLLTLTMRFRAGGVRVFFVYYRPGGVVPNGPRTAGQWWCWSGKFEAFDMSSFTGKEPSTDTVRGLIEYTKGAGGERLCHAPKCGSVWESPLVLTCPRCGSRDVGPGEPITSGSID